MKPSQHWGRRQRRLRRAAWAVVAVAVGATVLGLWLRSRSRPETRRPGEDLAEITTRLAGELPAAAPEPRFTDVTAEAGLGSFRAFAGGRSSQLPEDMGAGLAWGDFDRDGDDDLFLVGAGGTMTEPPASWAPSELYENLGDGTFRREAAFPETRILGMSAAWADADGDGWLDLVLTGVDHVLLFWNRQGSFERDDSLSLPGYWAGATWGDFDNDRDPDLYVCGYVRYAPGRGGSQRVSSQYDTAVPYTLNPASFEPERNLLFENDGRGSFTEVAALYGVSNPGGRSLTALWHDFDDDGRLDLYVANDISDNALYLNRGSTFEDAGLAAWVADYRGAMGLAAGDWNRDGDDDLFVTHWIAQENALYDSRLRSVPASAPRPAGETAVPPPTGEPAGPPRPLTFSDVAAPTGLGQIALQAVGWGTEFADFDSDGWLDLFVVNGSTFETAEQPPRLEPQAPFLLWNDGGKRFHDLAPLAEPLARARVGRGLALSDYDADGDVDIALMTLDEGVVLLRNDMPQGRWLELVLRSRGADGEAGSGFGDGATATATVGGLALRRSVGSASYLSQSSRTLHFGLGEAAGVDELEVRWPGGETLSYGGLAADARWEIVEGEPAARRVDRLSRRERVTAFWELQRAAMDAVKIEGDLPKAIGLFVQALELNPDHEDSRYYLANCLAAVGDPSGALAQLEKLTERNPMSHRGYRRWAQVRAMNASGRDDLEAAVEALERALELNPEETGSLISLGEVDLMLGDDAGAEERLEWACRSNPRAVGGFFLRAYISWRRGDGAESVRLLEAAREARGSEWKPEGAAAEGDVKARMHQEESPLARYWQTWDGTPDPDTAFAALHRRLGPAGS
ncbi:MAG: FG-GAP-like repeat-containing protein [Acidobacteriota bacterium]|nr:FG-GAP-like repeat-containing protein [Acidobacteriota bacterium]